MDQGGCTEAGEWAEVGSTCSIEKEQARPSVSRLLSEVNVCSLLPEHSTFRAAENLTFYIKDSI